MRDFAVRSSTPEDLGEILRIYRHYVLNTSSTFEVEAPTREEMAKRRASVLALGLPYLACEAGGVLVGYAYANAYRPRAAYRFTVEDSIYVDPAYAGRGCGLALLSALIAECEQGPWQQMIAVIGDSSNAASIGLHKKVGFREVGILRSVGFKFERWVDSVLMQRELQSIKR